jgi:hypothetical protein
VAETNEKNCELNLHWLLWDVRVVVEDIMVLDEIDEVVEDEW